MTGLKLMCKVDPYYAKAIDNFGDKVVEWECFRMVSTKVLKERTLSTGTLMVLVEGVCFSGKKKAWFKICPFDGMFELGRGFTTIS